ncbi:MAG: hypothetical protein E7663_02960 [Ruminococcaceae bacterium]|nr:hypothetical protein [Oscillospiraceae bacterium]
MNRRGDSSLVVDMLATDGIFYPLLATDDAHRYGQGNDADGVTSSVMVECDSLEPEKLKEAILAERFYATTGPEIHLSREGNRFIVDCSPACEVVFFSNSVWSSGRVVVGEELTHAEFDALPEERYIRACVTDRNGGRAWSNIIKI